MNALARILQDLLYLCFSGVVKLLGGMRTPQKSYALANALGGLRTRFGYIGRGWSPGKYLQTIRAVLPNISDSEANAILKAYWINHQKRFMELFLAKELTPQNIDSLVEFEDLEHLDRALERGRGVILPVPHIGNERLHHIALAVKGYPMAVISSHYDDHGFYARKIKIEASRRFHDVGHPGDAVWLLKVLKNNCVLQVASDAESGSNGVLIDFLGQEMLLPTGWVRLALKTGAAVFPSALLRQGDDQQRLIIRPEFELKRGHDRRENLKDNVQRYMDIVSEFFRDHPDLIDWMSLTVRLEETHLTLKEAGSKVPLAPATSTLQDSE
jgi:lauroyl/myristoyl acyltransferase